MDRIAWVDNAKSILIFLIIIGHFSYIYSPLVVKELIYAFHVPGFLIITGFLLPAKFGYGGVQSFFDRRIGSYLRAYALFSLIAIFIWWASASGTHGLVNPWPAIKGTIYGVAGSHNGLVHQNQPLWYFPFLVTAMCGAWICALIAERVAVVAGWLAATVYAAVAIVYHGPRLPWDLEIAGMGTLMIFAGFQFRKHYSLIQPWIESRSKGPVSVILLVSILFLASYINGPVNINGAEFGKNGLLFLAAAFGGTGVVIVLSAHIPQSRLARMISVNTLTIFALHIYFVRVAAGLPHPPTGLPTQLTMMTLAFAIMLICLPLARLMSPCIDRFVYRRSRQ